MDVGNGATRARLSLMMGLVYAVQGAFWPILSLHLADLGITGRGRGSIFATLALASFAMPLGAGQLVDRLMPIQNYLALTYALGTGLLLVFACGVTTQLVWLFGLFLLLWLILAPSYGLCNALAFRNLRNPDDEFGGVRLWGTAGWMIVGWAVSVVMLLSGSARGSGQGAYEAFWVSVVLSAIMAGYCLTLPNTPPLAGGPGRGLGLAAAREFLGQREMRVYLFTAFGVSLTTPYVFQVMPTYFESIGLPRAWTATAMTLGQWPEVVALAFLTRILVRFGYKATLMLGIAAWLVRYASLALNPPLWLALLGNPLHGIGIACFTVAGQMYMDTRAPRERRGSAQALNMVVTSGLGSLLGSLLAGEVVSRTGGNYPAVFLIPCLINLGLLLFFYLGFPSHATKAVRESVAETMTVPTPRGDGVRRSTAYAGRFATESADG